MITLDRMRILIGDPVRMSYLPSNGSAIQVDTEARVLEKLQEGRFDIIVLSENIGTLEVIPLMKNIVRKYPGVPVYFLYERYGDELFAEPDLISIGARARIVRPDSFKALFTSLKEKLFEQISCNPESPPQTLPLAQDLQEVSFESMTQGVPTLFELYTIDERGEVQFLVRKGEVLRELEAEKVYIQKAALENYLNYCDTLLKRMMWRSSSTLADRLLLVSEYGKQTLGALQTLGVSGPILDHAEKFSHHMFELLDASELSNLAEVKMLLLSKKEMEHSVQVSLISGILSQKMGLNSDKSRWIVGSSALLHDVGIFSLPPGIQKKPEEAMTREEFATYSQHPVLGADILAAAGRVDESILHAVAQHHERKDGKGFPKRLGLGEIHKMAELVGLAEEFVEKVIRPSRPMPLDQFMQWASNRFTNPILEAFASAFPVPSRSPVKR